MKILMVNKFLYPRGGAETYMLKIGAYLSEQGHEVEYFGMYDEKNTVGNRRGMYTYHMDFRRKSPENLLYPFKIIYSFEARKKLAKVLEDFKPDIVHMNNINFQLTPSIIDEVKNRKIPLVQTVHDYQMLCPNHLLYNLSLACICEKCVGGSKWNCTRYKCIHLSRAKSLIGTLEAMLYRQRKTYEKVDRYICPSCFLERKLHTQRSFRGKTVVLRNFIELPEVREEWKREKEAKPYVVFAGRLDKEKGTELILEAARRLPGTAFWVAGRGTEEERLNHQKNIRLLGFLSGEELHSLIAGASVMIVPSIWYENCPLSILESFALGTPVVTADRGGMTELVEHGKTGILIKNMDGGKLAAALQDVLSDENLLKEMSENCLKQRTAMMTLEGYCRELEALYQEMRR